MIFRVMALAALAAAYGDNDLTTCETFASQFDNTCDNTATPTDLASTASSDYTCSGVDDCVSTGTWSSD